MFLLFLQMFYINFHDVHIVISSTCHINLHPKTLFGCEWSRHSTIQGQKFTASDEVVKLLENKHRRAGEVGRWCVCLCVLCFCCLCFCFCLWRVFVYVCGCFLKIWDAVLTTMSDCGNLRGRDSLTKKTKKTPGWWFACDHRELQHFYKTLICPIWIYCYDSSCPSPPLDPMKFFR